jgi:hypothetical protein
LQSGGVLGAGQRLTAYAPIDLGEAQKRDPRFYQPGQYAYFLRRYGRYNKGDLCEVASANAKGIVILKDGRRSCLSYRYASRIVVAGAAPMDVAPGDRLQLKFNGRSVEGSPLNNGELVTVRRVNKNGALVVQGDGGKRKTLGPSQRLFLRGYAVTSYASQGKTVDAVLLADAGTSAATDANQWYVSISRGRKRVVVFTSDKLALREAVQALGERDLALDIRPEVVTPVLAGAWRQRALANIERVRLHNEVMKHVKNRNQRQRLAI